MRTAWQYPDYLFSLCEAKGDSHLHAHTLIPTDTMSRFRGGLTSKSFKGISVSLVVFPQAVLGKQKS